MNVVQQQLDVSKGLLTALDSLISSFDSLSIKSGNQAQLVSQAVEQMSDQSAALENAASGSQSMSRELKTAASSNAVANNIVSTNEKVSADMARSMKSASDSVNTSNNKLLSTSQQVKKSGEDILKTGDLLAAASDVQDNLQEVSDDILKIKDNIKSQTKTLSMWEKIISMLSKVKDAFVTGGISLLRDSLKFLLGFASTAFKMFTSAVGSMTKFFAFTVTLPFTIAKIAVGIGNQIRTDIVEVIQGAGEEAKESFDLTSSIGRNADKMTQTAKGLLKTFQDPRSRLVKLFNLGASGAAAFLRETFKAVDDMGHYAEIFGPSILGSTENAQFVIEMQRAMGIGSKEMAYYALEAYNAGEHPIDTLTRTSEAIKSVADRNDQDFKALTKDFHALRINITEFGHLSSNEIANLTGKLRAMKVKTEDAVSVFKKFTSFEEAAKSSAMLFQTFEMNIDAFDLLTARDPGEMLQQFRDAMFQTGRAFKDLNRHEKALMSSITGVSEQGLSSLMNYMDLGLTQDEARKKLEAQDPTKEQTKMIKGLTSTIKLIQKTMTFKSPFEAFFVGLSENVMNQKELKEKLISLSTIYSDIRKLGKDLKLQSVTATLNPIIKILQNVDETVNGQRFQKTMKITVETAGRFLTHVAYDLETDPAKLKNIDKKTATERIDELYRDLTEMTSEGSSLFGNMATVGGKIMGGIIKGAIYGITAAFHMLAGGTDKAVTSLGLTMTDQMKQDAAKKGIPVKDYTILDWLGISKNDADGISTSLGSAIGDFVKTLPNLIDIAGTLLDDISEVLISFAGSLIGILGDMTAEYYYSQPFYTRRLMDLAGFNIEAARSAKSGISPGESVDIDMSELMSKMFDDNNNYKVGYVGNYISYIEDLKNSLNKNSPASKFLNNEKTSSLINYLKDGSNFKFKLVGNVFDDAEEEERSQALLDIASKAYQINAVMPSEVVDLFESEKQKPTWYDDMNKNAGVLMQKQISSLVKADNDEIGSVYTSSASDIFGFANLAQKYQLEKDHALDRLRRQKKISWDGSKYIIPKSAVQDLEYTGKNTALLTPKNIFYLDDFDTVLAAKKGGFLNKLFIGLTSYFNETTSEGAKKLEEANSEVAETKAVMTKLKENIINRENLDYEATEDDFAGIFGLYDDIINIVTNRDNSFVKTNVLFEV